jgi:hypothetical protein
VAVSSKYKKLSTIFLIFVTPFQGTVFCFLLPKFEEPCFVLGNLKGAAERNKLRQSSTFAGSYSKKQKKKKKKKSFSDLSLPKFGTRMRTAPKIVRNVTRHTFMKR